MIDILINISVVFQIRVFFCNLLVHVLFPFTSYHSQDQEPSCVQNCEKLPRVPPQLNIKTAIKYIEDHIAKQIIQCTSIPCEWSITKA